MDTPHESPTLLALLLCDQFIDDRRSGKRSLIGLYDQINSVQFPVARDMLVVAIVSGMSEHSRVGLGLLTPGNSDLLGIEMQPPSGPGKVNEMAFEMQGVTLTEPGLHWLTLRVDGNELARRPINVVKVDPPPVQPIGQA
ncbi:MAG: hypothetical protein M3R04_08255 [bacterium]|nr:hypothetical protein [bacterium]